MNSMNKRRTREKIKGGGVIMDGKKIHTRNCLLHPWFLHIPKSWDICKEIVTAITREANQMSLVAQDDNGCSTIRPLYSQQYADQINLTTSHH